MLGDSWVTSELGKLRVLFTLPSLASPGPRASHLQATSLAVGVARGALRRTAVCSHRPRMESTWSSTRSTGP